MSPPNLNNGLYKAFIHLCLIMETWQVQESKIGEHQHWKRTHVLIKFEATDTISATVLSLEYTSSLILTGSICVYSQINFNGTMCPTMLFAVVPIVKHRVPNFYSILFSTLNNVLKVEISNSSNKSTWTPPPSNTPPFPVFLPTPVAPVAPTRSVGSGRVPCAIFQSPVLEPTVGPSSHPAPTASETLQICTLPSWWASALVQSCRPSPPAFPPTFPGPAPWDLRSTATIHRTFPECPTDTRPYHQPGAPLVSFQSCILTSNWPWWPVWQPGLSGGEGAARAEVGPVGRWRIRTAQASLVRGGHARRSRLSASAFSSV